VKEINLLRRARAKFSAWSDNRWLLTLFAMLLLLLIWFISLERISIEERAELNEATRETTNLVITITQQVNQLVMNADYKTMEVKSALEQGEGKNLDFLNRRDSVCHVLVSSDDLISVFRGLELGRDKAITIMGTDGISKLRYFNGEITSGEDGKQGVLYKNVSLSETGTFRDVSPIDQIERIYSYQVLPEYGLVVTVGISVQEVLKEFELRKRVYLVSAAVSSLVVIFFCGMLFYRNKKEVFLRNVLKENNQRLLLLHEATSHLLQREEGIDKLLETILQDALRLLGAPDGHISLLDASGKQFVIRYGIGLHAPRIGEIIFKHEGMHGEIYYSGRFLYVEDYSVYPQRLTVANCSEITSAILVPLKIQEQIIGGFAVTWRDKLRPLTQKMKDIIHQYSVLAALVIEEVQAREKLLKAEERYRLTVEAAQEAILDWDIQTRKVSVMRAWSEHLNFNSIIQKENIDYLISLIHPEDREGHDRNLQDHLSGRVNRYEYEFRIRLANEDYIWVNACGKAIFDEQGNPVRMVVGYTNITDRKQAEILVQKKTEEIKWLAYTDVLTGLPNASAMRERLEHEIQQIQNDNIRGALLHIEVDNLQVINDAFGHSYGNSIICQVSNILRDHLTASSVLARLGAGQFAVLLDIDDKVEIKKLVTRLLHAINKEYDIDGTWTHISSVAGIVVLQAGDTVEEVIKNAGIALHDAKKNLNYVPWSFFEPSMKKRAYETLLIKNSLRHAIANNELKLCYQPKVFAANGKIDGFEALLRWHSEEFGLVSPLKFIPLAEETGLIHAIGKWVLRESCNFIKKINESECQDIHVAVNISPYQLSRPGFIEEVIDIIQETGIKPKQLELEITENVLLESLEAGVAMLKQLKAAGIRVSLDDFGTGYSSLNYLMRLPVQTLKLDKSFVDMIPKNQTQSAIAKSIIEMAHTLNMMVVAEGVETNEQLDYLKQCNCDFIQGYLISRPIPEEEVDAFFQVQ